MKVAVRDSSTLPLILSTSKYFRYVFQLRASFYQHPNIPDTFFGDKMHSCPLELGRKRVELNVEYFTQELLRKYLKKNICNFKSPISQWRGPQSKSLFWAFFFSVRYEAMTEAPFLLFQTFGLISSNFFKTFAAIFGVKNLGYNLGKATWSGQIYLFFTEKWDPIFEHFWLKNKP